MRAGRRALRITVAGLALGALAACGDPSWRNPATSRGAAVLTPEVADAAVAGLADLKPRSKAKFTIVQPLPALPNWGPPMIGKPLGAFFPLHAECLGNVDAIRTRYLGAPNGVTVVGWAWDPHAKASPSRVVLVDDSFLIRGAGVTGAPRPSVPKVRPEVTSPNVGWEALAGRTVGSLDAWGVLADGKTVCKLGHIEL